MGLNTALTDFAASIVTVQVTGTNPTKLCPGTSATTSVTVLVAGVQWEKATWLGVSVVVVP
jgi:hypothetical protein